MREGLLVREQTTSGAATAGLGFLQVEPSGTRSVVSRAYAASPLKLLTPRNHGRAAWIYTATYGGGLVGGDAIRLSIDVASGAAALLATQSSTKVYRSPHGTSARLDALVADDALLVVAPDPVVCFAHSTYRQEQHVELSGSGALVLIDWLSSGRRAAGERWTFDRYASRTTVRLDGRLIFYDALMLESRTSDVAGHMGRFDVLATVLVIGQSLGTVPGAAELAALPLVRRADTLTSVAPIGQHGTVLRVAGRSVEHVGRLIRQHLAFLPARIGDDPWSRKW